MLTWAAGFVLPQPGGTSLSNGVRHLPEREPFHAPRHKLADSEMSLDARPDAMARNQH